MLVAGAAVVQAQGSATATVTANVASPIAVTVVGNMSFGTVVGGVNKIVSPNDVTSGRFNVSMGNGTVSVTITPPLNMTSGTNNMPTSDWQVRTFPTGFTGSTFPLAGAFNVTSNGLLSIFVGGTVVPAFTQPPGTYTGSLVLSVSYL